MANLIHQLQDIPVLTSSPAPEVSLTRQVPVSLIHLPRLLQSNGDSKAAVGEVDERFSKLLLIIKGVSGLQFQALITSNVTQEKETRRSRYDRGSSLPHLRLSIIIYGPMEVFDQVGEFLTRCSVYLQSPVHCDRNVRYRNPQSLSGRSPNPPWTFDIAEKTNLSRVETLLPQEDPSSILETRECFPEAVAPSNITTAMYRLVCMYAMSQCDEED